MTATNQQYYSSYPAQVGAITSTPTAPNQTATYHGQHNQPTSAYSHHQHHHNQHHQHLHQPQQQQQQQVLHQPASYHYPGQQHHHHNHLHLQGVNGGQTTLTQLTGVPQQQAPRTVSATSINSTSPADTAAAIYSIEATKSTKGASKLRRDLINTEIAQLRELLPLPASTRQRLSQLQLMALVLVYVRKSNYFCHGKYLSLSLSC